MGYIGLLKWDLYAGIKRRILNIKFFKSLDAKFLLYIYIFTCILKIWVVYGLTVAYRQFTDSTKGSLIDNKIVGIAVNELLKNAWLPVMILAIYTVLTGVKRVNDVSKLTYSNRYIQWLETITGLPRYKIILCIMGNYNLLESSDLFTILVPVFVGCYVNSGQSVIMSLAQGIGTGILIFLITYIGSIWKYVWLIRRREYNLRWMAVLNIGRIAIIMWMFTRLGMVLTEWMNRFPLVKKKVESIEFERWIDELKTMMLDIFYEIPIIADNMYQLLNINKTVLFLFISLIILGLSVWKFDSLSKQGASVVAAEYGEIKGRSNFEKYYYATIYRGDCLKQNFKYIFGGNLFWCFISFYGGLMTGVNEVKVFFFLAMTCALYASLFLGQTLIRRFNIMYTLDGEGRRIKFWIENLKKLMGLKEKIWILNVMSITIIEYVYMYICSDSKYVLLIALFQLVYMIMLVWLYNIPSIVFPYYEYKNYAELIKYADREKIYDVIDGLMILLINTVFVIPTAIFMTDYIDLSQYIFIQFILVAIVIMIAKAMVQYIIYRKIGATKYIHKMFVR